MRNAACCTEADTRPDVATLQAALAAGQESAQAATAAQAAAGHESRRAAACEAHLRKLKEEQGQCRAAAEEAVVKVTAAQAARDRAVKQVAA